VGPMTRRDGQNFHPELIARQLQDAGEERALPPVEEWQPDYCGDMDLKILRDGRWLYMGTPITRVPMVRLFSTILRRDEDGRYYLVTPVEKIGITVEDAPFVIVSMHIDGEGEQQIIHMQTNVGDTVKIDADHPIWVEKIAVDHSPRPYVRVRGRLHALVNRATYYALAEKAVEEGGHFGIWSAGCFFPLEDVADAQ